MKKYHLIDSARGDESQKLYQIQALKTFTTSNGTEVKEGDLGGFISGEHNLSHEGNCWVANSAEVWDQACVSENGYLGGFARLYEQAQIYGNALVRRGNIGGNVKIYGNAEVSVKGDISDDVEIYENAVIASKDTEISGSVKIFGNAYIGGFQRGNIQISEQAKIYGNAQIGGTCQIKGNAEICGDTVITGSNVRRNFNEN